MKISRSYFFTLWIVLMFSWPVSANENYLVILNSESTDKHVTVNRLQQNITESIAEIMAQYDDRLQSVTPFWLAGGFSCQTDVSTRQELAEDPRIREVISLNKGWGLNHRPAPAADRAQPPYTAWVLDHLGFNRVREIFGCRGGGIRVGLVDTGISGNHPELAGRLEIFRDFIHGRTDAYDDHGHGTFIAGILAGGQRTGAAPDIRLLVTKAINADGVMSVNAGLNALTFLADPDGNPDTADFPPVILCPFNNPDNSDRSLLETMQNLRRLGILIICPTRMDGPAGVGVPAGYPSVLSVGGTTDRDTLSWYSGYGLSPFDNKPRPTLAAPAEWIFSTLASGGLGMQDGADYASAYVAATAALLVSISPAVDAEKLESLLKSNCRDLGDPRKFGAGLLQPEAAVKSALSPSPLQIIFQDEHSKPLVCKMRLQGVTPPRVEFQLETSAVTLVLAPGNYRITADCYRYQQLVATTSGNQQELRLQLLPGNRVPITIGLSDQSGQTLSGAISFLGHPGLRDFDLQGATPLIVEPGRQNVLISAYGYEPRQTEIICTANTSHHFKLKPLPAMLLIDDDGPASSIDRVADSLQELGIRFRLYRPDDMGRVTPRLLAQFSTVYWHLGPRLGQHLAADDMNAIASFLDLGGCLILTGQDVAWNARNHRFLRTCLGAGFRNDNSLVNDVFGSDDYPEFAGWYAVLDQFGADSAQLSSDVICRADGIDGAREVLQWGPPGGYNPGAAAILYRRNPGISLFLSFGLEGIPEPERRNRLLQGMLSLLNNQRTICPEADSLPASLQTGGETARRAVIRFRQILHSLPAETANAVCLKLIPQLDGLSRPVRQPAESLLRELRSRTLMEN